MPLKDTDDAQNRFRSAARAPQRARMGIDISRPVRPTFPVVGASLPLKTPQRSLPQGPVQRPRAALASATLANVASPPLTRPLAPAPAAKKGRRRVVTKKRVALVIVLLMLLAGGWVASKLFSNTLKVFHGNVFSILNTAKLKGEDTGRVNILLAGNSADDVGHNGANLTDSIMVISMDVKHNTAFMLSVPRDLWVEIPGYGHAKINEAYVDGQAGNFSAPGYANGGMGLLADVIHQNFHIPINYYALIDYNALRDGVNAVGGIDVDIQSSDPRGLYDPSIDWSTHEPLVRLTNGAHHLNGEQALDFARARGDAYGAYGFVRSDFDRTEHQRMMMLALKNRILTVGTLANPVALGKLFDSMGKNVKTDVTLSEVRRMYDLTKSLDNKQIQSAGLNDANGKDLLASYRSPTGQSALIPAAGLDDFSQIQAYVRYLMTSDPVAKESATVVVLNGTSTSGLAAKAEASLAAKNIATAAIGDASAKTVTTTIIDASGGKKPATLRVLEQLYGTHTTVTNPYASIYDANFIVVLGADQATTTGAQQ
jgi:LCP family protein required for cell wall assembly